ncbi:MAG TPA: hypothetical protein PKA82_07780 [Pyrinomonadaceae bacterium]|nr:hypothetical protein [Pyrinomonadaceae bacterium]
MNTLPTVLDLAIGTAFTEMPEALSLLILSVGLIAMAGVLRWIFTKFDVIETTVENKAK